VLLGIKPAIDGKEMILSLSIVICTRDRADSLARTLDAVSRLKAPLATSVELLVIDNGSKDNTSAAVARTQIPWAEVRCVREPRIGLAVARNTGLKTAKGEVLIFTDDDVRPSEEWLEVHHAAYANPEVSAVAGKVDLSFDTPPPDWVGPVHRGFLASCDHGPTRIFPFQSHLIGANMSVRASVAKKLSGFNELLGAGRTGFWEESEFSERLLRAGLQISYEPRALVHHQIIAGRLTPSYFRKVAFRNGVSSYMGLQLGSVERPKNVLGRFARSSLRRVKSKIVQRARCQVRISSQDELFYRMEMGSTWAHLLGMDRLKRHYGAPVDS
jgi:glycosyltransferase involved in cell wall biosynthesis